MTQMKNFNINKVLDNIIHITEQANIYIDKEAPWALRKTDPERMKQTLYLLLEVLRYIAIMLQPFIPDATTTMLDQLNIPVKQRSFANLTKAFAIQPGAVIQEPKPIFPKLEQ